MKQRLLLIAMLTMSTFCSWAGNIFVSVNGDDANDGTMTHPVKTVHQALRIAREWRRLAGNGDANATANIAGGIDIKVEAGRYDMNEPLLIRPEDSGSDASWTRIIGDGEVVFYGDEPARHTIVYPKDGMERMIAFDKKTRTITIPKKAVESILNQSYRTPDRQLEMVVHQRWAIAILRVKDIRTEGNHAIVSFMEPESRLEFEHPWPQPVIGGEKGNSSFLLRWTERREGIETLMTIQGHENEPVRCFTIQHISFENTCWNRPQRYGHVTLQGGFPILDAYQLPQAGLPWDKDLENQAWVERPVAAVRVNWAENIKVFDCKFQHLGATALDFGIGIRNCEIYRNLFSDIGGTAILAGSFAESPREVHRPYTDLAGLCCGLSIISNNINTATVEDWGCVGIGCGYVKNVDISHNIVENVNYSGICVGWGWTDKDTGMAANKITNNTVKDFALQLYDAGGIYTLSNQPASEITDNIITGLGKAPYATNDRGFYIYLDAKTDGYTIDRNECDEEKFGDNHPGPNIVWGVNGPGRPKIGVFEITE